MELLQLKYFQVVARLESITRAAGELHIAQPSLSKTMARLEENLGVPLFDRQGRRLRLNPFGKAFLKRVERGLSELEAGRREVKDLAGLESGSVTVGATTSRLLPGLFRDFLLLHPQVRFRLLQVTQQPDIGQRLADGEIDLGISSLPIRKTGIECFPLATEEIFIAVPPGHRLAGRKAIALREVADEPFIHLTSECELREITNVFCRQAGFAANIAFESDTAEVICNLAKAGLGIAFIPAYWWGGQNTRSLGKLHVGDPICQRTIWLSWVKERYLSAARDFAKFVADYFASRTKANE